MLMNLLSAFKCKGGVKSQIYSPFWQFSQMDEWLLLVSVSSLFSSAAVGKSLLNCLEEIR
jgi:hypothetical protein